MNDIFFSICIPTYNRPEFILKSLMSVMNQKFQNFEILIHDNSEDDKTEKIISQINDDRLFYSRHEKNIGLVNNWNSLLKKAKGTYIKFLNDDDEMHIDCLEEIYNEINLFKSITNLQVGVVTCCAVYLNEDKIIVKSDCNRNSQNNYYIKSDDILNGWLENSSLIRTPSHSAYHRQSVIESLTIFSDKYYYALDIYFGLQIAEKMGVLVLDRKPLINFYVHGGQEGSKIKIKERLRVLMEMNEEIYAKISDEMDFKSSDLRGRICLREMFIMLKQQRFVDVFYTFNSFMKNGSFLSFLLLRKFDFQKKYNKNIYLKYKD